MGRVAEKDRAKLSLTEMDPHDRLTWKRIFFKKALPSAEENHHHHHVDRSRTSMTLFFQYFLSLIAVSKSSLSRLVSSVSWLIKFRAGLPLVFLPHLGSHSINLCITSLLRKQSPAKLTLCCNCIGYLW